MRFLSESIGIDPGTSSVRIFSKSAGVVLNEPSLVAVDSASGKILAAGFEADDLIGKIPDGVNVVCPIKRGEITDYSIAEGMFRIFLDKCMKGRITKPRIVAAVPTGCTDVQKRAIEESIVSAGAKSVSFKDRSLAAAVGAGINIEDISGNMIIDLGCGSTGIAVISMGTVVASKSVGMAGTDFVESIIRYVKNKHGVNIGHRIAEEVKTMLRGDDFSDTDGYIVIGRDVLTGLPRSAKVLLSEIKEVISKDLETIIDAIRFVIEATPPELLSDIMEKGAVLTGGSAVIPGFFELIDKELDIKATIAANPASSVIMGLGSLLRKESVF